MATHETRALARQVWRQVEPFHSLYIAPEGNDRYAQAGLEGGWMRYFGSRSSLLGAVPAEVVVATFYGFHPRLVSESLPSAWDRTTPEAVRSARIEVVDIAVRNTTWAKIIDHPGLARALELLGSALASCPVAGRPLYAAHRAQPEPEQAHLRLWWYATLLREHRGDGHIAALVAEGVGPIESIITHCATGEWKRDILQPLRGLTDQEWEGTTEDLVGRGWLETDSSLSSEGRKLREHVEAVTDDRAAEPWLESGGQAALAQVNELLISVLQH